jgi:hypothetical protein
VRRLCVRKAPGPTGMRTDHLKEWLASATREENPDTYRWDKCVELIQHVHRTGQLPQELYWSILAIIPKGSGGSRGIGLLEVSWKVISSIIDTRLKDAIKFHDTLNGFTTHHDTGTATIEANLRMHLSQGQRKTLYQVFIDLKKAYDTLDRGRTLKILKGYGSSLLFQPFGITTP